MIQFEKGACWGYDKFYAIDKLESAGFLLPEKDTVNDTSVSWRRLDCLINFLEFVLLV